MVTVNAIWPKYNFVIAHIPLPKVKKKRKKKENMNTAYESWSQLFIKISATDFICLRKMRFILEEILHFSTLWTSDVCNTVSDQNVVCN